MKHGYYDIMEAAGGKEPLWWDVNGTPRFAPFEPKMVPDIYSREVGLLRIACSNCGREFDVAMSSSWWDTIEAKSQTPLADLIKNRTIHYGDPPNVNCCPAGPTMNSDPLRVIGYWRRNHESFSWDRLKEFEIDLTSEEEE